MGTSTVYDHSMNMRIFNLMMDEIIHISFIDYEEIDYNLNMHLLPVSY